MEIKSTFLVGNIGIDETLYHPHYIRNQNRMNNIALVKLSKKLDSRRYKPLPLRGLRGNSTCTLIETRQSVMIYEPDECSRNSTQAYCSRFRVSTLACFTLTSSPVMCGDRTHLDGIIISEGSCTKEADTYLLYYHSVADFREWIEEITSGGNAAGVSVFALLSIVLISLKWLV